MFAWLQANQELSAWLESTEILQDSLEQQLQSLYLLAPPALGPAHWPTDYAQAQALGNAFLILLCELRRLGSRTPRRYRDFPARLAQLSRASGAEAALHTLKSLTREGDAEAAQALLRALVECDEALYTWLSSEFLELHGELWEYRDFLELYRGSPRFGARLDRLREHFWPQPAETPPSFSAAPQIVKKPASPPRRSWGLSYQLGPGVLSGGRLPLRVYVERLAWEGASPFYRSARSETPSGYGEPDSRPILQTRFSLEGDLLLLQLRPLDWEVVEESGRLLARGEEARPWTSLSRRSAGRPLYLGGPAGSACWDGDELKLLDKQPVRMAWDEGRVDAGGMLQASGVRARSFDPARPLAVQPQWGLVLHSPWPGRLELLDLTQTGPRFQLDLEDHLFEVAFRPVAPEICAAGLQGVYLFNRDGQALGLLDSRRAQNMPPAREAGFETRSFAELAQYDRFFSDLSG